MTQVYGHFGWTCRRCGKHFEKNTPQGLGLAKENHRRSHRIKFIRRDYEQYPEGICGEMCGDCMNCPLPENMRAGCVQSINGKPRTNVCTREDPFS